MISLQRLIPFAFFTLLVGSIGQASDELPIGRLYSLRQQIQIRFSDCGQNWIVGSMQAGCDVRLFKIENAHLIYPVQSFVSWIYDSGESWRLQITGKRTAHGYSILLSTRGSVPADRLEFKVAEKFIRDAFENGGLDPALKKNSEQSDAQYLIQTHVMTTTAKWGGQQLTPMQLADRHLPFRSAQTMQKCIESRFRFQGKTVCMIHMARYNEGEVILSEENTTATAVGSDSSKKLTVYFRSLPAWKNLLGASSLSYLRAEYEGGYTDTDFKNLYRKAVAQIDLREFSSRVLKPAGQPRPGSLYREESLGLSQLLRRAFTLNEEQCQRSWVVGDHMARCRYGMNWPTYRIGESTTLLFQRTEVAGHYATVVVYAKNSAYELQIYATQEVVSDYAKAKAFISKSISEQPQGMIYEYALGVESNDIF
jgi:hypothetical protein